MTATPALQAPRHTLTDAEYVALAGYLAGRAGLVFDDSRRPALAAIVADRLVAAGAADLGAYLARITTADGADEAQRLLDEVTIPETHFFRNPPQMVALRERLLPELMRRAVSRGRPLSVWSAGSSSGEEAYSLAILAAQAAAELSAAPRLSILATDVSSRAVEATRRARYTGRSLSYTDPQLLEEYFDEQPDGSRVVREDVRCAVTARLHNLVTEPAPFADGEVDLIVCRNVTIYFTRDTMRELVGRFHTALSPGGYLVVGHAETLWQITEAFTLVPLGDAFAYRKDVPATPPAPPAAARPPERRSSRRARPPELRRTSTAVPTRTRAATPAPDPVPDPDRAGELLAQAREAMEQAQYSQAARLAEQAALASPFEVDAYVVEGLARATVGDDSGALVALRKAVYLAPRAGHARFLLAGALARCGEPGGAAREYRAAAATLPSADPAELQALLDGCDVTELVALCRRLADACDLRVGGNKREGGTP